MLTHLAVRNFKRFESVEVELGTPVDPPDWPRQHKRLARHLNDLHRVFSQRVRDL